MAAARCSARPELVSSCQGEIIASPDAYNPYWSFYLKPDSINFLEMQIEVGDANVMYVEEYLEEVGGKSTLPNNFWCPWSSRLVREMS